MSLLKLDTGASGLLISQAAAQRAGLVAEAEIKTGGLGDEGPADTYVTHVDDIKIGEMEFRNCMVRVLERPDAVEVDGLIGSDVFRRYLVTLDMPRLELGLAALPKVPEETAEGEIALNTTGERAGVAAQRGVRDRYIAPEMKDWTKIYRVGHELIFPTRIGSGPTKLFILDSGASRGLISQEAAREVTEVSNSGRTQVRGINWECQCGVPDGKRYDPVCGCSTVEPGDECDRHVGCIETGRSDDRGIYRISDLARAGDHDRLSGQPGACGVRAEVQFAT